MENRMNEVKTLKSEVLNRAHTCVRGMNYILVTDDMNVTVMQEDQYNTHHLISFPANCTGEQFDRIVSNYVTQ